MARAKREYVEGLKLWNGMYYGEVLHDKPHGKGRLVKANGDVESGTYKNGMPDKDRVIFYANGDVAEYALEKHNVVGKYKLTCANGEVQIHEYEPGKKIGVCWHYYPDGSYYKGVFNQGKRDKTGVMVYPDGRAELWTYDFGYLKGKKVPLDKNDPRVKDAYDPDYVPTPPPVPEFPVGKDALQGGKKTQKKQAAASAPKKEESPAAPKKEGPKAAAPAKAAPKKTEKKPEPPKKTHGRTELDNGDIYEGDMLGGKFHGKGKYISHEGWNYVGGWENHQRSGKGTIRWDNGDVYEGDWEADKRSGKGTYRWANGNLYEGEFVNGKRTGQGVFSWGPGKWEKDRYEGEFQDGMRQGQGAYYYGDGTVYRGQWEQGKKHGQGVYTYSSGNCYDGQWKQDKRHGQGKYIYSDGSWYTGEWAEDTLIRQSPAVTPGAAATKSQPTASLPKREMRSEREIGSLEYEDGSVYKGEILEDQPDGYGEMVYADGSIYHGDWVNGSREGQGVYTSAEGDRYEGGFLADACSGRGKMVWADGSTYDGDWLNDQMEGEGTYIYPDGRVYIGEMSENESDGYGEMRWPDGQVYEGFWYEDEMQGWGKMIYPNGETYDGEWDKGERSGEGKHVYKDGDWYEGGWHRDGWYGHGAWHQTDGKVSIGGWNGFERHGVNRTEYPDGSCKFAVYKNGEYDGLACWQDDRHIWYAKLFKNGHEMNDSDASAKVRGAEFHDFEDSEYYGQVRRAYGLVGPEGIGRLRYKKNNHVESGQFGRKTELVSGFRITEGWVEYGDYNSFNRLQGFGRILFKKGCYEGPISDGWYDGTGIYYDDSGYCYTAVFDMGELVEITKMIAPDGTQYTDREDLAYQELTFQIINYED